MLRRARGCLFDFGSTVLAGIGLAALVVGTLQAAALFYINNKWPPVSAQHMQAEAVARNSAALGRMDAPNLLLQVEASAVRKWLQPELQKAVLRLNESRQDLHLVVGAVDVRFKGQHGALSGPFELRLAKQGVTLTGSIEGLAYLALDGSTVTVRPAFGKLKLDSVRSESEKSWWLPAAAGAIFAELVLVRDNINGQLPTFAEQLRVAPVTLPGQPRPGVPISFPDPFHAGSTITQTFVPPVLKGAAVLADGDHLTVLGQLSLDDVPAPGPDGARTDDFLVFRREFQHRLASSGLAADPVSAVSFDLSETFIKELFRQSIGQVFTRDRVTKAVQASYEALPQLRRPDVGVSLDTPTLSKVVEQRLRSTLDAWASANSGNVTSAKFEVRPQHFWAAASAAFDVTSVGARVAATVAVAVPVAGSAAGVKLYPAVDQLAVTQLRADSFGDLAGLLRGVNTFLAGAIGAANAALQPVDVGLEPLTLGTIDFRSMVSAPEVSVSPQTYKPPAMALANAALLLDESRVMVMADANTVTAVAPADTPPVDFDTYRKAYQARWAEAFGDPARPGVAHAYVRTSAVARYVNTTVNNAHLALSASVAGDSKSSTPLEIGEVPRVQCKGLLHCPGSCGWNPACWTWKFACEAANAATSLTCRAFIPPVRAAINEITRILGRHLGDLETDARYSVNAQAREFRLNLADDFGAVRLKTTVTADATASADLRFHSKSVSGVLVCPLDFRHHVPFPSGDIHARLPAQELGLRATIQTGLEPASGGRQRFGVVVMPQDDIHVSGSLDTQPYLQLRLVMLSMNVQCPVTNVLNVLVPGLGTALAVLDIGQIGALITDGVAKNALNGLPDNVKLVYLGKIERKLNKPGPMRFGIDVPSVRMAETELKLLPEIKDGFIQMHLTSR